MSDPPFSTRSVVCPTHGLRYDPGATRGCIRCRSSRPPPLPRSGTRPAMSVLAALLMVLTLAAGAWFAFERLSPREVPARAFTDRELFDEARRVHVVIYSATWCPSCDAAKSFLWQNSVPFEEHDIDKEKDAHERWVALNPQKTIPVIDVEGDVVVGAGREPMIRALLRASRHHLSSARTAQ